MANESRIVDQQGFLPLVGRYVHIALAVNHNGKLMDP